MQKRKFLILALIMNACIVIMEIIGLILSIGRHGQNLFLFYTQDSNIFAGITSIIFCVFSIIVLIQGDSYTVPKWVKILRYLATCTLMVTFLVVVFILAPAIASRDAASLSTTMIKELHVDHGLSLGEAYRIMLLDSSMLYHHLLCPLFSFFSFVFLEKKPECGFCSVWIALIPTILYASVLIPMNIMRTVSGPYPFLMVHDQSISASILWCLAILTFAWLIALGIWKLNRIPHREE